MTTQYWSTIRNSNTRISRGNQALQCWTSNGEPLDRDHDLTAMSSAYNTECWKTSVASNRQSNFPNQMSTTYPQDLLAKRHFKWYHDIQYFAHFSWILSVKSLAPKIVISTAQPASWWKWFFPYLAFRIPQPICSKIISYNDYITIASLSLR